MLDFNFFEMHSAKHEKQSLIRLAAIIAATFVISIALMYPAFNYIIISRLSKEISTMKSVLNADNTYDIIEMLEEKKLEAERLNGLLLQLEGANLLLESKKTIDERLIGHITANLPRAVYIQSLDIKTDLIDIRASSANKEDIAQFEYNLKSSFGASRVFIPSIAQEEELYKFSLIIDIEVNADED